MRKLLFILFLFPANIFCQKLIESSMGFDKIQTGMSFSALEKIQPFEYSMTYKEEKDEWITRGYDWDVELVSHITFDKSYTFPSSNPYGLWTVFTNGGKVVLIQISKKYFPLNTTTYPSIDGKVNFGDGVDKIENTYGKADVKQSDFRNTVGLYYLSLGIAFYVWEDEGLTTMHIFEKMEDDQVNKARRKMQKLTPAEN